MRLIVSFDACCSLLTLDFLKISGRGLNEKDIDFFWIFFLCFSYVVEFKRRYVRRGNPIGEDREMQLYSHGKRRAEKVVHLQNKVP
jgi:hypothetical protein